MGEDDPRMLVNTLFSLFGKYVSPQGGEECRELCFSQLEVSRKNKTKAHVFLGKKKLRRRIIAPQSQGKRCRGS